MFLGLEVGGGCWWPVSQSVITNCLWFTIFIFSFLISSIFQYNYFNLGGFYNLFFSRAIAKWELRFRKTSWMLLRMVVSYLLVFFFRTPEYVECRNFRHSLCLLGDFCSLSTAWGCQNSFWKCRIEEDFAFWAVKHPELSDSGVIRVWMCRRWPGSGLQSCGCGHACTAGAGSRYCPFIYLSFSSALLLSSEMFALAAKAANSSEISYRRRFNPACARRLLVVPVFWESWPGGLFSSVEQKSCLVLTKALLRGALSSSKKSSIYQR